MIRNTLTVLACALSLCTAGAQEVASSSIAAGIRAANPATSFKEIRTTPIQGIYEVLMGATVAYTDEAGKFFIFGHLFDIQKQVDLTANRLIEAKKVEFPAALLGNAIKTVKGDGSRALAIFSDPDCDYCKQLEATLTRLNNVTIYTFLYPLEALHPNAKTKAIAIWCAPDRGKAWGDAMLGGRMPKPQTCANPIHDNLALGARLGVVGTPTLIALDGRLLPGAAPADQIEKWLEAAP